MQVTYQLTPEDFFHGLLTWRTRRAWWRWTLWFAYFAVGAMSLLCLTLVLLDRAPTTAIAGISFGVVWFSYMLYGPKLFSGRQFRNMPSAQAPHTMDISESGLALHTAVSDASTAWSMYVAWAEGKSVFIILPQPRIYVPIPKRAFTEEQLAEFREILRRNIAAK